MRRLFTIPLLLLGGCADLGYYWHNASGHLGLMNQRVEITEMLAEEDLDADLRARLNRVHEIRRFAVERLALPDNGSYREYVALDRPYVVQNLFAAPEFSTRLHSWCYPIVGCASYRGYFDEARLQRYIEKLRDEGFEVYVGRVSAYSTLGWFDDPVLSTFIDWPEYRLAGLLFHELTHQRIYIDDDTTFNESLASAVQQVGTELWLESQSLGDQLAQYRRWQAYRDEVIELIATTRAQLDEIYASDLAESQMRTRKEAAFVAAREAHAAIAAARGVDGGFKRWFAGDLNNAKIGSISAYHSETGAFRNMLQAHGLDFAAFYDYVEALGKLEADFRKSCLAQWRVGKKPGDPCPTLGGTTASLSGARTW